MADWQYEATPHLNRLHTFPMCVADAVCRPFTMQMLSPADAGVVAIQGQTVSAGALANVTFTISANGPGSSSNTAVNLQFPPQLSLVAIAVTDPAGIGKQQRMSEA